MPRLKRLYVVHTEGLYFLERDFESLRSLVIDGHVRFDTLFKILDRLPGLEGLRIKGLQFEERSSARALVAMRVARSRCPLSVRTLEVDESRLDGDYLLALVVGQLPRLVLIQAPKIYHETLKALWDHCYELDTMHRLKGEVHIQPWRDRRADDAHNRLE